MKTDNWLFIDLELNNYELTSGNWQCQMELSAYFYYLWKIISETSCDAIICVDRLGTNIVMIIDMGFSTMMNIFSWSLSWQNPNAAMTLYARPYWWVSARKL